MNLISFSVTILAIIISLFMINLFVALTTFLGFCVLCAGNIILVSKKLLANLIILSQEFKQIVKIL
jgi:hypothetical protein